MPPPCVTRYLGCVVHAGINSSSHLFKLGGGSIHSRQVPTADGYRLLSMLRLFTDVWIQLQGRRQLSNASAQIASRTTKATLQLTNFPIGPWMKIAIRAKKTTAKLSARIREPIKLGSPEAQKYSNLQNLAIKDSNPCRQNNARSNKANGSQCQRTEKIWLPCIAENVTFAKNICKIFHRDKRINQRILPRQSLVGVPRGADYSVTEF